MTHCELIPVLSTPAGRCLTAENWQAVNVQKLSCTLEALIIKPGLATLLKFSDWREYLAWSGEIVLNVQLPRLTNDIYTFRSPYDGAKIQHSQSDILVAIMQLKPNAVILPRGFDHLFDDASWGQLSATSFTYIPAEDVDHYPAAWVQGIYYAYDNMPQTRARITGRKQQFPQAQYYISGRIDQQESSQLRDLVNVIESDIPAQNALEGRIIVGKDSINLLDSQFATEFVTLDPTCQCPTRTQAFTRAYLHHLIQHTPLLAQRLLIQHNIFASHLSSAP